jgi:hypothetical protein
MKNDIFKRMRDSGFLNSEARRISQIPQADSNPWVAQMVRARVQKWHTAARRGHPREEFDNDLVEAYIKKGWTIPGYEAGVNHLDVNAMVREYCDKYRAGHPEYSSPWETRARNLAREHKAIRNSFTAANARVAARLEGAY